MIQLQAYVITKIIKDFGTVSWVESSEFLPLYLPTRLINCSWVYNDQCIIYNSPVNFFTSLWMLKITSGARFKAAGPEMELKKMKIIA